MVFSDCWKTKIILNQSSDPTLMALQNSDTNHIGDDCPRSDNSKKTPLPNRDIDSIVIHLITGIKSINFNQDHDDDLNR